MRLEGSVSETRHGTVDGYTNHRCRCGPCRAARREYDRRRRVKRRSRLARRTEGKPCASGIRCAAVDPDDLVPKPATLGRGERGPVCNRCLTRAGVA